MKILLISDYAAPIGGSEISLLALRKGLRQRGHEVRLFASRAEDGGGTADDTCFGTTSRWRTLLQSANPWAARKLQQVLADFQPDVIHVQLFLTQLSPLILPLLQPTPALYFAVWYRAVCPVGTKMLPGGEACSFPVGQACYRQTCLPLRDWLPLMGQMSLLRRWQGVFDLFIANGSVVEQALIEAGISPVKVIKHSVESWPISETRRAPYPLIVFAGRLVYEKGVDVLITAFARVAEQYPTAHLVVAGDGRDRDHIADQIDSLDLNDQVTLLGHIPQNDLHWRFETAWVQVVPSRWFEPFGMVAVEAMMRGTAVIATGTGGLADIVQDGQTGLLVPPDDADGLAAALLRLLGDQHLREKMGRKGRELAMAEYGQDGFVDGFLAAYLSMLEMA